MTSSIPNSTIQKWRRLVELLVDHTKSDRIVWKESVDDDAFLTTISGNIIMLAKISRVARNGNGNGNVPVVQVSISSAEGKKIDEFDDETLDGSPGQSYKYFNMLKELIEVISRKNSGAEEVLDKILAGLTGGIE